MRILLTFIQDNRLRLVDWFNQFDKDHSGGISREEFKTGLKETGLVMTQVCGLILFSIDLLFSKDFVVVVVVAADAVVSSFMTVFLSFFQFSVNLIV